MQIRIHKLLSIALLGLALLAALGWRTLPLQAADRSSHTPQSVPHVSSRGGDDDDGGDDHGGDDHGGDDNGGDDNGDDDNGNEIKVYGIVNAMPTSGLTGTWVISGTTYNANAQTEFEMEHGGFVVGGCVEVEANASTPTVAKELGTESAYKCTGANNGDDDDDDNPEFEGKFFGAIATLPAGPSFIGTWVIGSQTVIVNANTRLEQEHTAFANGVVVEVEFREVNGEKVATEIEAKTDHGGHGGDDDQDDDHGNHDGDDDHDGQAFGPIVSLPQGMVGAWNIAGLDYTVTLSTTLDDEGVFAVGVNVKVEYNTTSAGERIATEIEITNDDGGVDDANTFKFVGWVQAMPQTFIGDWTIGGQRFTANSSTRFEEEHGLLVVSAYVEATYKIEGDQRILVKLESEVPPGAGDDNNMGRVENLGDDNPTVAAAGAANTWQIGGKEFVILGSTQILNGDSALALGSNALVNSYSNASGANVATRIQSVSFDYVVQLPMLTR